jgi:hypothetical protein
MCHRYVPRGEANLPRYAAETTRREGKVAEYQYCNSKLSYPIFHYFSLISTKMRLPRDEIHTIYDAVVQLYDSLDTAEIRAGTLPVLPAYGIHNSRDAVDNK